MFTRLGLALLVVLALPADGQQGTVKGKGSGRSEAQVTHARASDAEIRVIREYYSDPSRKLKPIPPGIWKNLGRGKKVPPGISRTRLPGPLAERMPRREGADWWIAGDQVLLVDTNNNLVDFFRAIR